MNIAGVFEQAGLLTNEGLTLLFRYGIRKSSRDVDLHDIARTEKRFKTDLITEHCSGILSDAAIFLSRLDEVARFNEVVDLIIVADRDEVKINEQLKNDIVKVCESQNIVRFSFCASIVPCLAYARTIKGTPKDVIGLAPVRYTGMGSDVQLMAFASIFLNLPIYVEDGFPWEFEIPCDDDGDYIVDFPSLEISVPPPVALVDTIINLEKSVRKSRIPRAVDRGKCDVESVMIKYLNNTQHPCIVFASREFLTSPKLSRSKSRQELLSFNSTSHITELAYSNSQSKSDVYFSIEITNNDEIIPDIIMGRNTFLGRAQHYRDREFRGKLQRVSVDEIRDNGGTLLPSRYLGVGPTSGKGLGEHFSNRIKPGRTRLSDIFEIIRPKTTRHESTGTLLVEEVRAGDITEQGEVSDPSRLISVRESLERKLANQELRAGDILLAHKAPVGRVAYFIPRTSRNGEVKRVWAAQSVLILRAHKRMSGQTGAPICDPRILFMYLLSPAIREYWRTVSTGDRSPSLSISSIERLEIPESVYKFRGNSEPAKKHNEMVAALQKAIVSEFETRQKALIRAKDLRSQMEARLVEISQAVLTGRDLPKT